MPNRPIHRGRAAAALLFAAASFGGFAQTDLILRDRDVTERSLIEALTPEPKFRTRSIRVGPDRDAPQSPARKAAASMLITFETNSAELKPEARKLLDTLGKAMQSEKLSAFRFAIEGHADPRGGEAFNLDLSQRRAESVVSYLAQNHQIDPARLKPVGKGQSELFDAKRPETPENRRVTVKTLTE